MNRPSATQTGLFFSPFESGKISTLFKGECQNFRIEISETPLTFAPPAREADARLLSPRNGVRPRSTQWTNLGVWFGFGGHWIASVVEVLEEEHHDALSAIVEYLCWSSCQHLPMGTKNNKSTKEFNKM